MPICFAGHWVYSGLGDGNILATCSQVGHVGSHPQR